MDDDPAGLRLAQTVVARLCHDLSGALGAVLNGLELAATRDSMADEAMQFAQEAAREVAARLRLARALWDSETPLDLARLPQLADGLPNRTRLQLDFAGLHGAALPPPAARLLLAVLMAAAEALHGAGEIALDGEASREIAVIIAGPRAAWPADLPDILAAPAAGLEPRGLALRLAGLLARQAGARLSLLIPAGAPVGPPPLLISLGG